MRLKALRSSLPLIGLITILGLTALGSPSKSTTSLKYSVQDRYQHFDLNDEFLELDAIEVQNDFRAQFCAP